MHVQRLSSAEPHAARRQRDGSTQSNQSSNESTLCLSTTVRIAFGARNLVPFPHNDLIKTQLRHGSNSSRPLLKAAGARHGTNNKSSSTTSPIPSTLYHSNNTTNHTHTHNTNNMSGQSNVGNSGVYQADDQRTVKDSVLEEEKKENRFHEGKDNSHLAQDSSTLSTAFLSLPRTYDKGASGSTMLTISRGRALHQEQARARGEARAGGRECVPRRAAPPTRCHPARSRTRQRAQQRSQD
jgi:hypothetical protein